jgi:hypothetical protein
MSTAQLVLSSCEAILVTSTPTGLEGPRSVMSSAKKTSAKLTPIAFSTRAKRLRGTRHFGPETVTRP